MKRTARLARVGLVACLAVTASAVCHDLRGSAPEVQTSEKNAEQDAFQQEIARRDRLRRELSELIASTRSKETRHGLSPHQLAAAVKRIRRLGYDLQESEAKVSSLELDRGKAINKVVPKAISREEMCRLRCRDQITKLLVEKKRPEASKACPRTQHRLAATELSIAEQRLQIADANVSEARCFPPGAISEEKFRLLLSEVKSAKMRVDKLRSAGRKSDDSEAAQE